MIVTVPEYKKIYYSDIIQKTDNSLNESRSFFDSLGERDPFKEVRDLGNRDYIESLIPIAGRILALWDVYTYTIDLTDDGLVVNVNDHLFLPNKKLNTFNNSVFRFGEVKGNVNFSNNGLTDWSMFPKIIHGDCNAQFNFIKNFDGAPLVLGKMMADKQNKKPNYPLTDGNYKLHSSTDLSEDIVYLLDDDTFGCLEAIYENLGKCAVSVKGKKKLYNLNRVEYFGNTENLFI